MISVDLGECEWFVRDLQTSNLVERGQIEQLVGDFFRKKPRAEPAQLAEYLVQQRVLTQFQADSLLQGKKDLLVVGPYLVADMIGFGSMGTVYKARSKVDKQWYAVKVLPSRGVLKLRNAKQIARDFKQIKHPSVVPFADAGAGGSTNFLAWPFVEGGATLQKVVEARGQLSPGQAAHYVTQIAEGLAMCHEKGLTHGLLKPPNIMIKPDQTALVLDMGIGTLLGQEESVIHTGGLANLAASADCAAPETAIDPTAGGASGDQYSLGCVLYYCLTGRYPFEGDNYVSKMMAHQTQQPPPVQDRSPNLPAEMVTVLQRMMAKKPADRYESMFHVLSAIRPFAKPESTPAFDSRLLAAPTAEKAEVPAVPPSAAKGPTIRPAPDRPSPAVAPAPSQPPIRPPWTERGTDRAATGEPSVPLPQASRGKGNLGQIILWFVILAIAVALIGAAAVMFFK